MRGAMRFAKDFSTPCAFRYPRGEFYLKEESSPPFELGKSNTLKEGRDVLFIGYGNGVGRAVETAKLLKDMEPTILDLRFVKPLDEERLKGLSKSHKRWFVFSDSVKMGGVGSAILEFLNREGIRDIELISFEYEDSFITHGNTRLVEESLGLLPEQLGLSISICS
jgi:1-deoxy-D-xylulose-5-phosphate synthase